MTIDNWQNKKAFPWLLSVLSGILLWVGWPTSPVPYFLFIGLVATNQAGKYLGSVI